MGSFVIWPIVSSKVSILVKNLSDNFNYVVEKKATTIIIPSLIEKFFENKLNSNKEFFDFSNNSKIKVHVKKERTK